MVIEQIAFDTNIVIDILNGKLNVVSFLKPNTKIYLPVTVCGELLFGARNSGKSQENEFKFREFIKYCEILNINELIADQYATTRKILKNKGRPIPENDIWIAATCIVNNIALLTYDTDFTYIEELILIDKNKLFQPKN